MDHPTGTDFVDTHVHLFAKDEYTFPLAPDPPYRPRSTLTPAALIRQMDKAGVEVAVAVQPEPYGADHRYLRWCVRAAPDRLRAVGLVLNLLRDPADEVGRLSQDFGSALVGVRIHLHGSHPDPPGGWLGDLGQSANTHQLFIQILGDAERVLGASAELAASGSPIVVDHMARLGGPGRRRILQRLAALPSVVVKVSELHARNQPALLQSKASVGAAAIDVFGPFRVIFGSGHRGAWNARQYRRVIDDYRTVLHALDPPDRAAVLRENAMALIS